MERINDVVNRVKLKIGVVVADNQRLRNLLKKSVQRNESLRFENEKLQQKISELRSKVELYETAGGFVNISGGTKSARERVGKLVKEIDTCIALMNK